jgi:hypothetical protein
MARRKWDAKTKALIVIEGLKAKPVAEICIEHHDQSVAIFSMARSVSGLC